MLAIFTLFLLGWAIYGISPVDSLVLLSAAAVAAFRPECREVGVAPTKSGIFPGIEPARAPSRRRIREDEHCSDRCKFPGLTALRRLLAAKPLVEIVRFRPEEADEVPGGCTVKILNQADTGAVMPEDFNTIGEGQTWVSFAAHNREAKEGPEGRKQPVFVEGELARLDAEIYSFDTGCSRKCWRTGRDMIFYEIALLADFPEYGVRPLTKLPPMTEAERRRLRVVDDFAMMSGTNALRRCQYSRKRMSLADFGAAVEAGRKSADAQVPAADDAEAWGRNFSIRLSMPEGEEGVDASPRDMVEEAVEDAILIASSAAELVLSGWCQDEVTRAKIGRRRTRSGNIGPIIGRTTGAQDKDGKYVLAASPEAVRFSLEAAIFRATLERKGGCISAAVSSLGGIFAREAALKVIHSRFALWEYMTAAEVEVEMDKQRRAYAACIEKGRAEKEGLPVEVQLCAWNDKDGRTAEGVANVLSGAAEGLKAEGVGFVRERTTMPPPRLSMPAPRRSAVPAPIPLPPCDVFVVVNIYAFRQKVVGVFPTLKEAKLCPIDFDPRAMVSREVYFMNDGEIYKEDDPTCEWPVRAGAFRTAILSAVKAHRARPRLSVPERDPDYEAAVSVLMGEYTAELAGPEKVLAGLDAYPDLANTFGAGAVDAARRDARIEIELAEQREAEARKPVRLSMPDQEEDLPLVFRLKKCELTLEADKGNPDYPYWRVSIRREKTTSHKCGNFYSYGKLWQARRIYGLLKAALIASKMVRPNPAQDDDFFYFDGERMCHILHYEFDPADRRGLIGRRAYPQRKLPDWHNDWEIPESFLRNVLRLAYAIFRERAKFPEDCPDNTLVWALDSARRQFKIGKYWRKDAVADYCIRRLAADGCGMSDDMNALLADQMSTMTHARPYDLRFRAACWHCKASAEVERGLERLAANVPDDYKAGEYGPCPREELPKHCRGIIAELRNMRVAWPDAAHDYSGSEAERKMLASRRLVVDIWRTSGEKNAREWAAIEGVVYADCIAAAKAAEAQGIRFSMPDAPEPKSEWISETRLKNIALVLARKGDEWSILVAEIVSRPGQKQRAGVLTRGRTEENTRAIWKKVCAEMRTLSPRIRYMDAAAHISKVAAPDLAARFSMPEQPQSGGRVLIAHVGVGELLAGWEPIGSLTPMTKKVNKAKWFDLGTAKTIKRCLAHAGEEVKFFRTVEEWKAARRTAIRTGRLSMPSPPEGFEEYTAFIPEVRPGELPGTARRPGWMKLPKREHYGKISAEESVRLHREAEDAAQGKAQWEGEGTEWRVIKETKKRVASGTFQRRPRFTFPEKQGEQAMQTIDESKTAAAIKPFLRFSMPEVRAGQPPYHLPDRLLFIIFAAEFVLADAKNARDAAFVARHSRGGDKPVLCRIEPRQLLCEKWYEGMAWAKAETKKIAEKHAKQNMKNGGRILPRPEFRFIHIRGAGAVKDGQYPDVSAVRAEVEGRNHCRAVANLLRDCPVGASRPKCGGAWPRFGPPRRPPRPAPPIYIPRKARRTPHGSPHHLHGRLRPRNSRRRRDRRRP